MKKVIILLGIIGVGILAYVFFTRESEPDPKENEEKLVEEDTIVNSFVFVGCNRMWWKDTLHSDLSMANIDALKNIYSHVAASSQKTDYFFLVLLTDL